MNRFKLIIAIVLLASSIVLIFSKLFTPQPIQVVLETGQEVTTQTPNYYTLSEVLLLITASFVVGASTVYLFYNAEHITTLVQKPEKPEHEKFKMVVPLLKHDEKAVFTALQSANGEMLQNQLVLKTGLSKVAVTRAVSKLESKNLVVKERHGLTNKIKVKQ